MKTIEELKKHLKVLNDEVNEILNEIKEPFNNLEDSENYNYYNGALTVINNIIEFLGQE